MDIYAINTQPGGGSGAEWYYCWAYSPIVFQVLADSLVPTNQPMYCDIYFYQAGDPVYYKTISGYGYTDDGYGHTVFNFDIQDACQEMFGQQVAGFTLLPCVQFVQTTNMNNIYNTTTAINAFDCVCFFRGSTFDSNGLLVPNTDVPVQGTANTAPTSGTGTESYPFQVFNAARRPLDSSFINTSLAANYLKQMDLTSGLVVSRQSLIYPMSNCPAQGVDAYFASYELGVHDLNLYVDSYENDYGAFPFFVQRFLPNEAGDPVDSRPCNMYVLVADETGSIVDVIDFLGGGLMSSVTLNRGVWYMPTGRQDFLNLLGYIPASMNTVGYYYCVMVYDVTLPPYIGYGETGSMVFSPWYKVRNAGYEQQRLWFQNGYGVFEQLNFIRTSTENKSTSSEFFTPLQPVDGNYRNNPYTGRRRYNVRNMDSFTVTGVYAEAMMPWVRELLASPVVMMQVPDPQNVLNMDGSIAFGPNAGLLPVAVLDSSIETRKENERYHYVVTLKLQMGWDYVGVRS